jgi:hypothetical protein
MDQGSALMLTLAVELPVVIVLLRRASVVVVWPRAVTVIVLASLVTHPLAWRVARALSPDEYTLGIAIIEAVVVAVEALWLRALLPIGLKTAALTSLIANAASFGVGALLWWLR